MKSHYSIEPYGTGFLVADYSGKRGKHGAAYAGKDGVWRDQPVGISPFESRADAEKFASDLK